MKSPIPLSLAQEWQGSPQHCYFKGCPQDEVQLTLTCPASCPKEGTGKYQLSPSSFSGVCLEPKSQQRRAKQTAWDARRDVPSAHLSHPTASPAFALHIHW